MHYEEQQRKLMKNLMSEAYYDDPRSIDTDPNEEEDGDGQQRLDQSKIEELDMVRGAINSSVYGKARKRKSTQYEEYENSPEGSSEEEEEPKRRVIRSN